MGVSSLQVQNAEYVHTLCSMYYTQTCMHCVHMCVYTWTCVTGPAGRTGLAGVKTSLLAHYTLGDHGDECFFTKITGTSTRPLLSASQVQEGSYCFVRVHLKIVMWYDKTHKIHSEEETILCVKISKSVQVYCVDSNNHAYQLAPSHSLLFPHGISSTDACCVLSLWAGI